jgi:hypothetical protein
MPELTLHFESAEGTDLQAVASHLTQRISSVAGVETAEAEPQVLRLGGLPEILTIISFGTAAITSTTLLLKALKELL